MGQVVSPNGGMVIERNGESLMDVEVIGAGLAGLSAALRAVELGARTVLVTRDQFGVWRPMTDPFPCGHWPMRPGCSGKLGS